MVLGRFGAAPEPLDFMAQIAGLETRRCPKAARIPHPGSWGLGQAVLCPWVGRGLRNLVKWTGRAGGTVLVAGRPPCPHVAPLSPHGTAVLVPRGAVPGSLDLRCSAPAPFRCCQGPVVTAGTWGQLRHPSLTGGTPGGCSRMGAPGRCHLAALRGAGAPAVSEEGTGNPKQLHRPRGQRGRGETLRTEQCSAPSTPRV